MVKEEKTIDEIADREAVRMWYKDYQGHRWQIVKYADPYGQGKENDDIAGEYVPIYVFEAGTTPVPLGEALTQLRRFREQAANEDKRASNAVSVVEDNLWTLQNRFDSLEKRLNKKWWKLWTWGRK